MDRDVPSIFKKIPKKEKANLIEAIKGKKYWNISEGNKNYVYAVALSRARNVAPRGYYVKTSVFGKVEVIPEAAKYCRRYRILLIDVKAGTAFSVLTWMAFRTIMMKYSEVIEALVKDGKTPTYINRQTLRQLLDKTYSKR